MASIDLIKKGGLKVKMRDRIKDDKEREDDRTQTLLMSQRRSGLACTTALALSFPCSRSCGRLSYFLRWTWSFHHTQNAGGSTSTNVQSSSSQKKCHKKITSNFRLIRKNRESYFQH